MLAHHCQAFQHRYTPLRMSKRITIIAKLNRLERSLTGKLLETGENVFLTDTREPHVSSSGIAIAAAKGATLANRNEGTVLFHGKQDSSCYVRSLVTTLAIERTSGCFHCWYLADQ